MASETLTGLKKFHVDFLRTENLFLFNFSPMFSVKQEPIRNKIVYAVLVEEVLQFQIQTETSSLKIVIGEYTGFPAKLCINSSWHNLFFHDNRSSILYLIFPTKYHPVP